MKLIYLVFDESASIVAAVHAPHVLILQVSL